MIKNKILYATFISICTANIVLAETKQSDIIYDVVESKESAYGELKGYVPSKSSTGSKMDVDITEIPQSVSVITKDMINSRLFDNISSVISYDASVNETYGNEEPRANYSRVRGSTISAYNSTFLDGLKLLLNRGLIPKIDPYGAEKVELLKGPASALYGASGVGGIINIQSKKAGITKNNEIGITAGNFNTRIGFFDINNEFSKNIKFRLTGKIKKANNGLETSKTKDYFLNPAFKYIIDDNTSIDVLTSISKLELDNTGLNYNGTKVKINYHKNFAKNATSAKNLLNYYVTDPKLFGSIVNAYGKAYANQIKQQVLNTPTNAYVYALNQSANNFDKVNYPYDSYIGSGEDYEKSLRSISTVFNKNFNESAKFRSIMRFMKQNARSDYTSFSPSGLLQTLLTTDFTVLPLDYVKIDEEGKSFAIDNNFEYKYLNDNIDNTTLIGLDFQYIKAKNKWNNPETYFFDIKKPMLPKLKGIQTLQKDNEEAAKQLGVYVQNHLKIDNSYVITAALRYDKLKQKTDDFLTKKYTSQSDDNISGRVGFSYLFDNGLTPYISYATSFVPNIGINSKTKKEFKPSIGTQIEAGLKYKPKNLNALFTFAAYSIKNKDVLTTNSLTRQRVQESDEEIKGLEFNIVANPFENTNITLSLAKTDGKQKNKVNPYLDGKKLSNVADFNASLWADYTFKKTQVGDLNIGAGLRYAGKSTNFTRDYTRPPANPYIGLESDSYTMVDARIGTEYKNLNLALNVNNVFDKTPEIARTPISSTIRNGRTVKLTAKYKF